jgi:hypothetical protein
VANKGTLEGFARTIEDLVTNHGLNYMEAIMHYADSSGLEIEVVASMVKRSEPIRAKFEAYCKSAALLKGRPSPTLEQFIES